MFAEQRYGWQRYAADREVQQAAMRMLSQVLYSMRDRCTKTSSELQRCCSYFRRRCKRILCCTQPSAAFGNMMSWKLSTWNLRAGVQLAALAALQCVCSLHHFEKDNLSVMP